MSRWLIVGVAAILCLAASCAGTPQPTGVAVVPTEVTVAPDTFPAPDFSLRALDGTSYTLSRLRGRWVLVNFWATWCVPCVEEMPALQAIAAQHADDLTLLGINMREPEAHVGAFAAEHHILFPLLLDPPDQVVADYLVMGLPQTVIIDPAGALVWRQFGPLELETFDDLLTELMNAV